MGWKKRQPRIYKVTNNQIRYAGRTDLKCLMLPDPEAARKVRAFIDFKTGKAPNLYFNPNGYDEWPLQTAAYRKSDDTYEENGIVHLDKETGGMLWFPYNKTYKNDIKRFEALCNYWWLTYGEEYKDKLRGGAPSVTTICGMLDKPALVQWAANSTVEYISERYPLESGESMSDLLEEAKKNYRRVSAKAMDIGTQTHGHIEAWIKSDGKVDPPSDAPDEVTNSFVAFLDWWKAHKVEPIEIEVVTYGKFS